MDTNSIVYAIAGFLIPYLPYLTGRLKTDKVEDTYALRWATAIWDKIKDELKTKPALKEAIGDVSDNIYDDDARSAFRLQLKKLLMQRQDVLESLSGLWTELNARGVHAVLDRELASAQWLDVLKGSDDVLQRLEMIRLLRTGVPPQQIVARFHTDLKYLYRVHSAFTLSGVYGILSGSNIRHWMDGLNPDDPFLRRLEMIRLLRSGTPVETIATEYNATKEYIYRLNDRFTRSGTLGIFTEDDMLRYRSFNPRLIRVCSFNLHGLHDENPLRLKRIANELSVFDPELCAYQEVISGAGIQETSAQIATWMTKITGCYYRTHYAYCHQFMDKYPEGVAVSAKAQLVNVQRIDLNNDLTDNVRPLMERYAATADIDLYGARVVFASVHLDHGDNPNIQLAQAEKLLKELKLRYQHSDYLCTIIAGDFNSKENSPVMQYLTEEGYADTYRQCHRLGGDTFPTTNPFARIDYIMVKGNVRVKAAELILNDPELSDHIGLLAVIE
ncbi:MAG: endonuclease/exonuclease/phosphatase family protein [Nitrospirae bacterium]|uniref:endonuclease/exonuclease/phosphatase family protein n=1 Tax=Candidatus Magnetobacterium casense TaxID=1455061 RepID=UPI00058E6818|nr:endonuclease/exonuclease/phosphatase family protein [Candidatus Magnetobacterium casensis]MBF0338490.1 endonuclease/exonuclease/phosphatase family protein [Nitrospirota bacterium]